MGIPKSMDYYRYELELTLYKCSQPTTFSTVYSNKGFFFLYIRLVFVFMLLQDTVLLRLLVSTGNSTRD